MEANVVLSTSAASPSFTTTQWRATGVAPLPEHSASLPKPTLPPRTDDFHQDLVKKTVASEKPLTMMIGFDHTCGWLSGRRDAPYACKYGDTCGLILAQTTSPGAVMCFNEDRQTYDLVHACIDSSDYYSSSACDSSCVRNTFTSKWYWYRSVKFELPFFEYLRFTPIPYEIVTEEPIRHSSKTPVGAIVGGVVGGVAAIGAGFLIIFFCLRRRKKRIAGTTETSPSLNQVPLQSMAQNQDPAFYDSHSNYSSKSLQVSAQQYPPTAPPPQGGDFAQQPQASELQAVPAQQLQQQQPLHELQAQAPQLHPQTPVHEVAA
ncbi:hypothetical protein E4U38_006574 [Claviceps purpurea]|nr:hypothetical protein E4U38_006574 [Claviceps purpurea]